MYKICEQERQKELYQFLLDRGDKWTSMEQTTDSIQLYPAYFTNRYHNSAARRLLTSDIKMINASDAYDKIIISGSRGIKLANEAEFEHFIRCEYAEVFRKLRQVRKIAKKAALNRQQDIEGEVKEVFLGDVDG